MASTYSDLKIELIGTGEQTGTWGTTTNDNFSIAIGEAITGSADVAFSSADVTVTLTNTNASQAARNLRLNLTGTSGGARNLILGSGCQIEKLYLINNGLADAVTVKNTSGTGIAVPAGKTMFVYNNGTNVVDAVTHLTSLTTGTLTTGTLSASGVATFSAGTVSAPAITTTGDTNTGIFFPAADTIAFTEGGVESMRIDSAGAVGIGSTNLTGYTLRLGKNLTGAVTSISLLAGGTVQPDVTTTAIYLGSSPSTAANGGTPYTVATLHHHYASQGTFNADSTVTNQYGFFAASSLTGATNNYAFYSNIASGTGRWNFYASGTAENFFGGATTVSVNSTTDALRITQVGTGNALLVEDSTNPDSSPFVIDAGGNVIVGNTSQITDFLAVGGASILPKYQQIGSGSAASSIAQAAYVGANAPPQIIHAKSRNPTIGSHTIVNNGDTIGTYVAEGSDGTAFIRAGSISFEIDGTPATNDMPARLVFSTTADGASTPTERTRIDSAGRLRHFGTTILSNVDMLNASYDSVSFSVAGEEATPSSLFFSPDGTRMFVLGSNGDDVNQYSLSTPWLVSSASYVTNFSVSSEELTPSGLFFRADGLKMYIVGQTNDTVFQYSLTTPWSVATASYDSVSFSIAAQELTPTGVFFKPNGLTMYVVGSASDNVNQYTLSTAWNISTATFTQSFSISGQESASSDISFTGDGTRMFVSGTTGDDVTVYNLTTPWDISTSSDIGQFSVALQDATPNGIYVKPDGTKFYIVGSTNDTVFQYTIPSIDIQLTGTTAINGGATVAQDLTVDGNFLALNVYSGTYTPTLTNTTNVASSTASELQYMRVGSVVTVSGLVAITPTAASDANTVLRMSLPISSNFASTTNLGGTGVISSAAGRGVAAAIYADTTNDVAEFNFLSPATSALSLRFTFTYRIL
jgi:sugar lactone lactonase YvrE